MASSFLVIALAPSGNTLAEVNIASDAHVKMLKERLAAACLVPVQLQQLAFGNKILEDAEQLSAYAQGTASLTVTLVSREVVCAFASGSWGDTCVTGEGHADVLRGEGGRGEEIQVEGGILKIEEAYEGPTVDGDACIWAKWDADVALEQVVVLGYRLRMPGRGIGCCTVGLAEGIKDLVGGFTVHGQLTAGTLGRVLAFTPSADKQGCLHYVLPRESGGWNCCRIDFPHEAPDDGGHVVLAFDRARQEVRVALGGRESTLPLPIQMWPDADKKLFPFVAINSEDFNGFEELEEDDLPVLAEALGEDATVEHARGFFRQAPGT